MQVDKSMFLKAIRFVAPFTDPKAFHPAISGIKIQTQGNTLTLYATNLEDFVKHTLELPEETEEMDIAINAKLLEEIIKNMPEGIIEVEEKEEKTVEIKQDKIKFTLNIMSTEEFPEFPAPDPTQYFAVQTEELIQALRKVLFCVSTEEYTRNLNGVYFDWYDEALALVGTDGYRLGIAKIPKDAFQDLPPTESLSSFLLPLKSMRKILKLLEMTEEEYIRIGIGIGDVVFNFGNTELFIRMIDAQFPDYRKVINSANPEESQASIAVDRQKLLETIQRISIQAKLGSTTKRFVMDESLTLESQAEDYGYASEEIESATFQKQPLEELTVLFQPKFLIESLKSMDEEEVVLSFAGATKPLRIAGNSMDARTTYYIMPMRQ